MAQVPPGPLVSAEEYLRRERAAADRSEFLRGEVFAMAGASWNHNTVVSNLAGLLFAGLRGSPCRVISSDLKICTSASGLFAYPDVVVVCGQPQFLDEQADVVLNPVLVVEVLSPSTESFDRGRKFDAYRELGSLRTYVLVSQDRPLAEVFERASADVWTLTISQGLEGVVSLPGLGVLLNLAEVYERIEF